MILSVSTVNIEYRCALALGSSSIRQINAVVHEGRRISAQNVMAYAIAETPLVE